jgi:membrane-associated protease RseP (regulator of RpoE activity)
VGAYLVMVLLCVLGVQQPDYPPLLGGLPDTSAAFTAGLREGDRVLGLAGRPVRTWHDLEEIADGRDRARPLAFDLDRGGRRLAVTVPGADGARVLGGLEPLPRPPLVGSVMTGMPAYRAGLQEGDHVRAVDGVPVTRFDQIGAALRGKADRPVRFTLTRGGRTFDVPVTPMRPTGDAASSLAVIGIEAPRGLTWTERFPPLQAVGAGFRLTGGVIASVYQGLWLTLSQPVYYRQYAGSTTSSTSWPGSTSRSCRSTCCRCRCSTAGTSRSRCSRRCGGGRSPAGPT